MTTAKARHQAQNPLTRYRMRMPGITEDLDRIVGANGRCPRDEGLLIEAIGEEGVVARCVNCGFRHYNAVGRLATKIALHRAIKAIELAEVRGPLAAAARKANFQRKQEDVSCESDGED
jgi:hypothetical protein